MKTLALGALGLQEELKATISEVLNTAQIKFSWQSLSVNEINNDIRELDSVIIQEQSELTETPFDSHFFSNLSIPAVLISENANGTIRFGENYFVIPHCALEHIPSILQNSVFQINQPQKAAPVPATLFHQMVDKTMNEVFILNPDSQTFQYANPALLENMGFSLNSFLFLNFPEIFTNQYRDITVDLTKPIFDGHLNSITFQADLSRADGTYYPARVQMELLEESGSAFIFGVCYDLTEIKRSATLLEERKKITRELELSNKYKSTFFANLSHEMRTTLNSTLLLSEILSENREENLSEEQLSFIQTIKNSSNSLLTMLNEILDLSKIEAGKMSMRPEYVSIEEFCKELERLYQPVAREKGLRFEFLNDLSEEVAFKTDRLRVEQVLKNFISNALKFTHKGSIILRVFRAKQDESAGLKSGFIAFQVSDTGIGIPEEKQKNIFKGYMQADGGATEKKYGGTGLGLAISKNITELLGGKIKVESTAGKGSKFTAILPEDSSEAILNHAKGGKIKLTTTPASHDLNKTITHDSPGKIDGTILLVDDNETHNMALSEFLGFKIKHCLTADSAASALKMLEEKPVDCIILDMYLPDASGKDVIKKLKQDERYASIPTIIYSGKNISGEEEEELENLADAIIQKNVMSYRVLLSKVMGVMQKASENN